MLTANMAHSPLYNIIFPHLTRMPEWLRHDLAGKDALLRARAEEALAAMIVNAIGSGQTLCNALAEAPVPGASND